MRKPKFYPLGENALTVKFGNEISPEINDLVLCLAESFEQNPFPGFVETIPAYSSLTIFYDCFLVKRNFPDSKTAFEWVKKFTEELIPNLAKSESHSPRQIEIPVNFDKQFAPDLEFVAKVNDITPQKFIEIFTLKKYRVYMLGFLPGFAYMGELDDSISAPRKHTPSQKVPKGSVGIAGKQTGIYPLESPGGWQIIGKTNVELFTPRAKFPTYFQVGDEVKFIPV